MSNSVIETGVDKLVKLIEQKQKISIDDAAKELGVSISVIQEWADFLEEEGVINVQYRLTNTFLEHKKLTKKELEQKTVEFHGKKDNFIRRVETAIKGIENDTAGLDKLKGEFSDLQALVSDEIGRIKDKLVQLEKYESLKKTIDTQIFDQHKKFKDDIAKLDKEILSAKRSYQDILNDIQMEKIKLEKEKSKAHEIHEQEEKLREKLALMQQIVDKIRNEIAEEDKEVEESEARIRKLEELADSTAGQITEKRKKVDALVAESKEQEEKILKLQEEVLEEIRTKEGIIKKEMVSTEDVTKRFEVFFKKKNEVTAILDKVLIDREQLKHELNKIIKCAIAFEIGVKGKSTKQQIQELETRFKELDRKRNIFKKEIEKLRSLILSK